MQDPLRRPAAPARHGARPHRRPGAPVPRRADHRVRPHGPTPRVDGHQRAVRARQDRGADHPLHGRGAAPRRPGGRHRGRQVVAEGPPATWRAGRRRRAGSEFALPDGVAVADLPSPPTSVADGVVVIEAREPTAVLHRLTGWALERGGALDQLRVDRPSPGGRVPAAHRRRRGRRVVRALRMAADPGPLGAGHVLAQPGRGGVHLRVPADVPGGVHRHQRERQGRPRRGHRHASPSSSCPPSWPSA